MKKFIFILIIMGCGHVAVSQTADNLIGKWKLVKWIKNGEEMNINSFFKTEEVFQVFLDNNEFQSVVGEKKYSGKWKLVNGNTRLKIKTDGFSYNFRIDHFDDKRRIITSEELGTYEYEKVE